MGNYSMTLEELNNYRIGRNKNISVFPQDIEYVVYGSDIDGYMTSDAPSVGDTPYFKSPTTDVWLKMFLIV